MCFYCDKNYPEFSSLHQHTDLVHQAITEPEIRRAVGKLRKQQKIKINFISLTCKVCGVSFESFKELKVHIVQEHDTPVDVDDDGVFPYKILEDMFRCVLCESTFETFAALNKHINSHYPNFVCKYCGVGYATGRRMREHVVTNHKNRSHSCEMCLKTFPSAYRKKMHVSRVHLKMMGATAPGSFNFKQKSKQLTAAHG
jgi:PR domain zinc finger protein 5